MFKHHIYLVVLGIVALSLTACFAPKTPQETAQIFWEAVIDDDKKDVVAYSTLNDVQQYDGFAREWKNMQPEWGKVEIDEDEASIVTSFTDKTNPDAAKLKFVTYLVKQEDKWLVDYARTANGLSASAALGRLFDRFNKLGEEISSQLKNASNELGARLNSITEQLRELSSSLEQQLSANMQQFATELQKELDKLADSVERALKEQQGNMSDEEQRTLNQAVNELHEQEKELDKPSIESVAGSGQAVGNTWQKLNQLSDDKFKQYKQDWNRQADEIQQRLQKLLDELVPADSKRED